MSTENRHITQICDTVDNVNANLDAGQIAILTNGIKGLVSRTADGTRVYYYAQQMYYQDGVGYTYCDNDFRKLYVRDDLFVDEYIKALNYDDTYLQFGENSIAAFVDSVEGFTVQDWSDTRLRVGSSYCTYLGFDGPFVGFNCYEDGGAKFGAGSLAKYGAKLWFSPDDGYFCFLISDAGGNADASATLLDALYVTGAGHIYWDADDDTYVYHPAANAIGMVAGNAELMRLRGSDGVVMIGGTSAKTWHPSYPAFAIADNHAVYAYGGVLGLAQYSYFDATHSRWEVASAGQPSSKFEFTNPGGQYGYTDGNHGSGGEGDPITWMELWHAIGTGSAAGEFVINDGSNDVDVRMESNDNANMFKLDAGLNRVGIGTGTPDVVLHAEFESTSHLGYIASVLRITKCTSSGSAIEDGFGVGMEFELESSTQATMFVSGEIDTIWEDESEGDSALILSTMDGWSLAEHMRISRGGWLKLSGVDVNNVAWDVAAGGKFRKLYVDENGYVVVGDADVNNND